MHSSDGGNDADKHLQALFKHRLRGLIQFSDMERRDHSNINCCVLSEWRYSDKSLETSPSTNQKHPQCQGGRLITLHGADYSQGSIPRESSRCNLQVQDGS